MKPNIHDRARSLSRSAQITVTEAYSRLSKRRRYGTFKPDRRDLTLASVESPRYWWQKESL